ncbi:hypothetical protein M0657_008131 [Pyricularia oryzae]|uniref:Uncharacterized protein n=2 Tax=Pyricularia oryzae TaxID=318829 RepID=A0AA97P2H7_PYRO3|nr:hypothetical protein OOU_Y34scaffold00364g1 [Pyricularia oryzae Y34]KAI7917378.1 hypothetical protein M0657_008131 [Pyricularia oryzae]
MNIANSPQEKFTKMRRERQDWTAQYPAYFRQTRDDKEFIMFRPHQGSAALVQLVHSDVNVRSRCMTVHSVSYIPGAPLKPNQVIANEYQQYSTLRINTLECIHYAVVREHASRPIVLDVVAQSGVDKGPIIFSNGDKGWAQLETTPLVIIAKASTPCEATMIKVEAGIDPPEILRKPADPVLDVPAASGEEGASASASGKPANSASGGNTASASGGTTASAALAPEGNTASASGKPLLRLRGEPPLRPRVEPLLRLLWPRGEPQLQPRGNPLLQPPVEPRLRPRGNPLLQPQRKPRLRPRAPAMKPT